MTVCPTADSFLPRRDASPAYSTRMAKIGDIPIPLLIQMKDLQRGFVTEPKISHVTYDERIPDDIFDLNQLPEVVDSPFWKRHGIEASQGE